MFRALVRCSAGSAFVEQWTELPGGERHQVQGRRPLDGRILLKGIPTPSVRAELCLFLALDSEVQGDSLQQRFQQLFPRDEEALFRCACSPRVWRRVGSSMTRRSCCRTSNDKWSKLLAQEEANDAVETDPEIRV